MDSRHRQDLPQQRFALSECSCLRLPKFSKRISADNWSGICKGQMPNQQALNAEAQHCKQYFNTELTSTELELLNQQLQYRLTACSSL